MSLPDTSIPAQLTAPPVESDTVLPVVERITQNLINAIKCVKLANGYQTDLAVQRSWPSGNSPGDMVCVVMELDSEADPQSAPDLAVAHVQPYALWIFAYQSDLSTYPARRRLQIAAADVHKALMADYQRTETNELGDVRLATDTVPAEPAWVANASVLGAADGVCLEVRVKYRTNLYDPYQLR